MYNSKFPLLEEKRAYNGKLWRNSFIHKLGTIEITVIHNDMSMGHQAGLYEIGFWQNNKPLDTFFIKEDISEFLDYSSEDSRYNDNVIGYLTEEEINNLVLAVAASDQLSHNLKGKEWKHTLV